ncbi:crossover junction endodeoxyribonuclease RuvC [Desulfobotulus sp.]|jgi:crossover junction endodeoxyribonuclease RuvC|uniref:crossover junction endodeoxyribonuclease RuvC n=1 Tax=Desulfobotulus sp. TaxID=1940337 RepID=UPI002A370772|nr:crossover junction endodeoxyribonuclease RuvC [Desulfobotulus sp.]MDY0163744.1 crossover junction endodeoxyribonuclease RuvC [Desulfobotulus sp.]
MVSIVGLDPGLARTGIGIVRGQGGEVTGYAFGCIETSREMSLAKRLEKIYIQTLNLLKEEKPDLMVVEDVFSLQKYPRSGILLGKVTGAVLVAGCQAAVPVREVAVREAKKVLTGSGAASKQQLERAVRHVLAHPDPIRPDHASDALALALIGLYRFS